MAGGRSVVVPSFFFFNDTATTEIYTLSLHDALPICSSPLRQWPPPSPTSHWWVCTDRKSTRLNSSHANISYAVFCLKKKKKCSHTVPFLTATSAVACVSPAPPRA